MAKTAANLTDIINADALRALITEAAKSAAPEIEINLRDAIAIFDIERKFDNDRRAALKIVFPELDADNLEFICGK